jgi:hypothetical protein
MSSFQLTAIAIIAILIAIGLGSTLYTFWRRRHIDAAGQVKAKPIDPHEVREQNPPDPQRH